jgi:hypothetical protein
MRGSSTCWPWRSARATGSIAPGGRQVPVLGTLNRSVRPVTVVVLVAGVIVAAVFGSTLAGGAAPRAWKKVVVKNGAADPVPVFSKPPALRSGAFDVTPGGSQTVPAGVVLTDLVVRSMHTGPCFVTLQPGSQPGIELVPMRDANEGLGAELHLETGLASTEEQPLTLRAAAGGPTCGSVQGFWSGFER